MSKTVTLVGGPEDGRTLTIPGLQPQLMVPEIPKPYVLLGHPRGYSKPRVHVYEWNEQQQLYAYKETV